MPEQTHSEEDKWAPWVEREDGDEAPGLHNRIEFMRDNPSKGSFLFSNAI